MRKWIQTSMCMVGVALASAISAQTIIDTDFATGYSDGDLAGQNDWLALTGTGLGDPAFEVNSQTARSGMATNASSGQDFYVYLGNTPAGNAVDDEWDGSMNFTMNWTSPGWRHGAYWSIGTSSTLTNALEGADADDVKFGFETDWPDQLSVGTWDASGAFQAILSVSAADLGMDLNTSDLDSDDLALSWNMRKTRTADTYTLTATLKNIASNITHTGTAVSIVKPDAYATGTPNYMMGHDRGFGWWDGPQYWKHITIDTLSLVRSSGNAPALSAPVVTALGGDNTVSLFWAAIVEAESYDVERSLSATGPWDAPVNVVAASYSDSSVTAGTEYFYRVTAKATGATPSVSDVASATPFSGGAFINTSFAATDSPAYADGDLAGQNGWMALTNSLPGAFDVDSSGDGFAGTEGLVTTGGAHQVYYASPTANDVNATWSGTINFGLSTDPDGVYRTNVTDGVTNVYEIAELGSGYETFMFGVTSNTETDLDPSDGDQAAGGDDDVLITARVGGNDGRVDFGFNMHNWNVNIMLALERAELGWDPNGYDISSTNGADFATDMIQLDYVIGKQPDNTAYMATVTATVNGVTYEGAWMTTAHDSGWGKPTVVYGEELVQFGMSRAAPNAENAVHVSIDSISVAHTLDVPAPLVAPYNLFSSVGSLENTVGWQPFGGQSGFNVYRADAEAGPYTLIGTTVENQYADSNGLEDLRSYFYTVRADYSGTESVDSDVEIVRALAQIKHFSIGGDWTDFIDFNGGISLTSGAYDLRVGSGRSTDQGTLSIVPSGANEAQYHPEASQGNICAVIQTLTNSTYNLCKGQDAPPNDSLFIKTGKGSSLYFVEGTAIDANTVEPVFHMAPGHRADWAAKVRAVIYSGGIWYASEKSWAKNADQQVNVLDEKWSVLPVPDDANDPLMDVSSSNFVAGSTLDLSQLSRAGFLFENSQGGNSAAWFKTFKLTYGSKPSAYQTWCDGMGIFNEDTGATLDLDSDNADNITEWGLNGDPLDPANVGITERYVGKDESGNLLYIFPKRDGEGPDYMVKETSSLAYVDFDVPAVPYVSTPGGAWPGEEGFIAVTNVVPTADGVKFIKLDIAE